VTEQDLRVFSGRKGVLLDLDGTLYCNHACRPYVEEVDRITGMMLLDRYETEDPKEAFRRLQSDQDSRGYRSKTEALDKLFGISLAEQNRWRERWTSPQDFLRPDERALQTLQHLSRSFVLLLGTNNTPVVTRRVLEALGIPEKIFSLLRSSEDLGAAKPEERFFRGIVRDSGIAAEDLVSVGDRAVSDLAPAAELGMGTYLVETIEDFYRLGHARFDS
jgi:putative hydrolase of the HAD superfamily